MNNAPLEWDGQAKLALLRLGVSSQLDVTCERIALEIADCLETVAEIKEESQSILEKPIPRAGKYTKLNDDIRNLRKLASEKGCPDLP